MRDHGVRLAVTQATTPHASWGSGLYTAMALTGHRSVATVMKYYREVSQQDLASAVRSIDAPAACENTAEEQSV